MSELVEDAGVPAVWCAGCGRMTDQRFVVRCVCCGSSVCDMCLDDRQVCPVCGSVVERPDVECGGGV